MFPLYYTLCSPICTDNSLDSERILNAADLVIRVVRSSRLLRRILRSRITSRRRGVRLDERVASVLRGDRLSRRVEWLLLRRVVHSLGVVGGLLLGEWDALLRNGVIVRLDLGLHLDLVRSSS